MKKNFVEHFKNRYCSFNFLEFIIHVKQDSCIELLPEVQGQPVKSGKLPTITVTSDEETEMPAQSDLSELQEPKSTDLLAPTSDFSLLGMNHLTPAESSAVETPTGLDGIVYKPHIEVGNYSTSILQEGLFTNTGGAKYEVGASKDFKFDNISTPGKRWPSLMDATPLRHINNSSRALSSRHRQAKLSDKVSPEPEQNGFASQFQNTVPRHFLRMSTNPVSTPSSNRGLLKDPSQDLRSNLSSKRVHSDRADGLWNFASSEEPMDVSWR